MLEELFEPNIIILGIFGNIKTVDTIQDNLHVILQELGRIPDKILIPVEGNSSIYIQDWAESLHIKTQIFQSDWVKNGKIAQIIRDNRMTKECTHALVFIKTEKLEKFAEKLCKNGKITFTYNQSLTLLEIETSSKVLEPVRKSNKGTKQTLLKFQKTVEC
jgi:hypothetical protein